MKQSVSIIIPTYNEAKNLPLLVEEIFASIDRSLIDLELIIVDDGSPDGTGDVAESLAKQYPMQIIHRSHKLGLGSAVCAGFAASRRPILGVMDADLSHDPNILQSMILALRDHDIVVGSRFESGSMVEAWQRWRKMLSQVGVTLARFLTGVRDPLSGYFLMKRSVIAGTNLTTTGYKILFEILVKGKYNSVKELPFTFRMRRYSSSKLNTKEYCLFLSQIARYALYRLWYNHRSLLISAGIGLAAVVYATITQSVWLDEALSITFSEESVWTNIVRSMQADLHPPLYYLFLHLTGLLFGHSIILYRLWSMLAYAAAGFVLYRYAYSVARSTTLRAMTGLIFFLSPFAVFYGSEVRSFMLVVLLALVQYIAWERIVTGVGKRADTMIYIVVSIVASYIFYPMLFLLVGEGLYALTRGRAIIKKLLLSWILIIAAYAPWIYFVILHRISEAPGHFLGIPWWQIPAIIFVGFAGGRVTVTDLNHLHQYWPTLIISAVYAVQFLGLWFVRKDCELRTYLVRLLVVCGITLGICLGISAFRFSVFDPRYYAEIFPFFVVLAAIGNVGWRQKNKRLWQAATGLLIAGNVLILGLYLFNPWYAREPWKYVVPQIEAQAQPGDAIVFIGIDQPPPSYALYMKKDVPVISTYSHDLKDFEDFATIKSDLEPQLRPYQRIWFSQFLEWQKDSGHHIRDVVAEQFNYVKTVGFFKVEFDLYERKK